MSSAILIREATGADLGIATAWLAEAGLPSEDLGADNMAAFLLATKDGCPCGMIGLENFGSAGLLRSLVVDPASRGAGLGRRLVDELEARAAGKGVKDLWLLTIDADPFFARLGYIVRGREEAPDSIRGTPEFSSLCPGDAVLMFKGL